MNEKAKYFLQSFGLGTVCIFIAYVLRLWSGLLFETPRYGPGIHPGAVPGLLGALVGLGGIFKVVNAFKIFGKAAPWVMILLGIISGKLAFYVIENTFGIDLVMILCPIAVLFIITGIGLFSKK